MTRGRSTSSPEGILPPGAPRRSARRSGLLDRAYRQGVLRRLARLEHGRLLLIDGDQVSPFGREEDDLRATVIVRDREFYRRVALRAGLGAAEAYVLGSWSCDDLTALLRLFVRSIPSEARLDTPAAALLRPLLRLGAWLRRNTLDGSRRNIHAHYDLGNEFFGLFLDETMTYSCGIFETPTSTLREASIAKYDRICRKLRLDPRDHVIEIGTGWGGFALHAASRYGCRVTSTTISRQQFSYAQERVAEAGLGNRIELLLADYRALTGTYDKLVSIEMIEAVGERYLETFFRVCSERLKGHGLMLLQAITMPDQQIARYRRSVDFIQRYVFPGSFVPSLGLMQSALARATDFRIENLEDIRPHYARTLRAWRERFLNQREALGRLGYPEPFLRLWEYYFCYCEAGFAERYLGDVQILLAKPGCRMESYLP